MMRKYLLILSLLISAAGMAQAPNYLYGKDIIITTRDTSSAELTIRNTTRNVLGYFKNIGGGKGQYTLIHQTDIISLPDSLLARYTKTQSDARYKSISYVPDWLDITGKPSNFSTTYALSNDIQDSLLNKVSRSGSYADPSWITSLNYSKLVGTVPTWNQNTTGNAATVTNGVYTTGSYANPAWITSLDYSKLTGTVPTWNQNTTGTASSLSSVLSSSLGGAGSVNGLLKANGSGVVSAAVAGDIPSLSGSYVDLSTSQTIGGVKTFTNTINGTTANFSGIISGYTGITDPTVGTGVGTSFALNNSVNNAYGIGTSSAIEGRYDMFFQTGDVNGGGARFYRGTTLLARLTSGASLLINGAADDGVNKLIVNGSSKVIGSLDVRNSNSYFGSVKGYIYISDDQINSYYSSDADATLNFNYYGYNQGLTRFRNFQIYNGKGESIMYLDGAAKSANFSNDLLWGSTGAGNYMYAGGTTQKFAYSSSGTNNIYSGSVNGLRVINQADTEVLFTVSDSGPSSFAYSLTASSFIKSGGTSSQFLKADGSVDNNTYLTSLSSLSAGSGLIGTAYNGSAAQTFRVDTGRAAAQIITGGSLNKVRDSIVNLIPTSTPTAGYYTPTISGTVNITSSTMNECRWTRIGDIVTVSGSVLILPTTISSNVSFQITLPIDTEHPSTYELSGVGSATELAINKLVNITGLTSSNTAAFNYVASQNSASDTVSFMFTYKVIPL